MTKTAQRYAYLFAQGRVDAAGLARVVGLGLITQQEYEEITAPPAEGGTGQETEVSHAF